MNGVLNRGKTLRERILKNIYVYEIHYSKYQLVKSMYKIITSLFLRNHLKLIAIRDTVKLNVFKKSA